MKKNKISLNYDLTRIIIVSILAIMMLSGCNSTVQEKNDNQPVVNHNFNMNPSSLKEDEKILSLEGYGSKGALADTNLTLADMLMYAVQDEYLAHAEYLLIMDIFGTQKPYSNIAKSEETHLALLKEVYLAYGLDFPEDASADHVVVPASLLEAAQTGVQAEIDNIAMYELFLSYDLPENIAQVFTALKNASESHLLAFQKQVEKLK
ncbi:MAG TPA: DUF2202 domain-containing protein [Erysipelotrichaceae bacterium]|nr:DUF2202 domain-containing protein [Erysipelotrichaceae bacterium]HQB32430.1 DUF2202 domain-containing protein [Erysipelotrichaceae bacterium]